MREGALRPPPGWVVALALACGCSLTLDWDRTDTVALDGEVFDDASVDGPQLDSSPPPDVPAVDVPRALDAVGPDVAIDLPAVDRVTPTDRPCGGSCPGMQVCCGNVCRECCNDDNCRMGPGPARYCCSGVCRECCDDGACHTGIARHCCSGLCQIRC